MPRALPRVVPALFATGALLLTAAVAAPAALAAPDPVSSVVAGRTEPVYSYTDAVHESVNVATRLDSDGDGVRDVIAVDIVRPSEPAAAGTPVPVIMDASPYYACCGRGNESQLKTYDEDGVIEQMPLFYDNYFVPRGYAVVGVDIIGTGRSTGCGDHGGPNEIKSVTAVIDWLNGRNTATDLDGNAVTASWATGAVGMIGKSYDGTLANGAAATGVEGLKTIVPISAIDSWYRYSRSSGVVYSTNYVRFLTNYVGRDDGVCDAYREQLNAAADDATGAYNSFWRQRDYTRNAAKVTASVFAAHGVNDNNVKMDNLTNWWEALGDNGVTRKLWLTQLGHVDPFDFDRAEWVDTLHAWFDHELMGLDNGVLDEPAVRVERSPGVFVDQASWPATATTVPLGRDGLGSTAGGALAIKDNPALSEQVAVSSVPGQVVDGRLLLASAPLTSALRVSGEPTVTLRVAADRTDTPITAKLVDYGPTTRPVGDGIRTLTSTSCWGESSDVDSACYLDVGYRLQNQTVSVLSRGWLDAAYSRTLTKPAPLEPGKWRNVTIPLRAQDVTIPAGHQVGLVIQLSDRGSTSPRSTGATVTVDLAKSSMALPSTGAATLRPGTVTTAAPSTAAKVPARVEVQIPR